MGGVSYDIGRCGGMGSVMILAGEGGMVIHDIGR